jgi:UPF0271 protein
MVPAIDLNADLGETVGGRPTADDAAMYPVITSASIACGGHAGDARSMRAAATLSAEHGVRVGAHPAFPDPAGFGRVALPLSAAEIRAQVRAQTAALVAAGADVRYVKPHGALYHVAGRDRDVADAVVAAVADQSAALGRPLAVLGMSDVLADAAVRADLPFVREAFLDRGYRPDGGLVAREAPGALLRDVAEVADRAVRLALEGEVVAVDGTVLSADAASLCLHGDTPDAIAMAAAVRDALVAAGVVLRAPW